MKFRDVKDVLDFLNEDGMDTVKRATMFITRNCPNESDLKGKIDSCIYVDGCFGCWYKILNLEENQEKLDNVI